ncbi:hypothetical protein [Novosphingobium sp. 9]|uniref:hypothetical protein n=1 Tax=Novosphingobium sp. 9 TaxID=2025349 RepID=UPI0021B65E89|nr:hypothetical protein [Novosphingobium sp. 9]
MNGLAAKDANAASPLHENRHQNQKTAIWYKEKATMRYVMCLTILSLTACAAKTQVVGYPPAPDLVAATEAKPKPSPDILTDPAAADRYSSAVEAWGDRVRAAGVRLCGYFKAQGMKVECGS